MPPAALLQPRKQPRQSRSKATVEAIVDATARVLVREGYEKASTNRIAKVAGVSVGSLYQYFPNKEALVMAVIHRHCDEMVVMLAESARELMHAPVPVAVRTYIRAMVAAHLVNPELHTVVTQQIFHLGVEHLSEVQRSTRQIVQMWLAHHRATILPKDLATASFVLVAMVESVVHGALLSPDADLASEALTEELCSAVLRYLVGTPEALAPCCD